MREYTTKTRHEISLSFCTRIRCMIFFSLQYTLNKPSSLTIAAWSTQLKSVRVCVCSGLMLVGLSHTTTTAVAYTALLDIAEQTLHLYCVKIFVLCITVTQRCEEKEIDRIAVRCIILIWLVTLSTFPASHRSIFDRNLRLRWP